MVLGQSSHIAYPRVLDAGTEHTVLTLKTANVLSHSEPWFAFQPNSFARPRAIQSTRSTTCRDEQVWPVRPQVYGSRACSCATRPYFSLSMNSLMGILSGMGPNSPNFLFGKKTILLSCAGMVENMERRKREGEEQTEAVKYARCGATKLEHGLIQCFGPMENPNALLSIEKSIE